MDPGDIREGLQEAFSLISIISDNPSKMKARIIAHLFLRGSVPGGRLSAPRDRAPAQASAASAAAPPGPGGGPSSKAAPLRRTASPGHLSMLCESVLGAGAGEPSQPQLPRGGGGRAGP